MQVSTPTNTKNQKIPVGNVTRMKTITRQGEKGQRPSHQLVPIFRGTANGEKLYALHTRYKFRIKLPKYFYLAVFNNALAAQEQEDAKKYLESSLKRIQRKPFTVTIEKVRVIYSSMIIEIDILINEAYDKSHMSWLTTLVYERYRTMRDEFIRPAWLLYIESHNIKYRIKRPVLESNTVEEFP